MLMNHTLKIRFAVTLLAAIIAPVAANAALVLDTGAPTAAAMPMVLDGNDYYAAEFNLGAASSINSVSAYLLAGQDQPGTTFTMSIYAGSSIGRSSTPDYSVQGTYTADGWNTASFGGAKEAAGTYWVALEVGSSDSATGLSLPTPVAGGTAPALAFAFNSGGGYTTAGALPFGVQIDATPVPLPAAVWLLGSGFLGLGALTRRRRSPILGARASG